MRIDGKQIAQEILDELKERVVRLKKKGIISHLHIITLTTDAASNAYVSQKKLKGGEIGAKITVENLSPNTKTDELLSKIERLNNDKNVHGIVIQRPLPSQIEEKKVAEAINPKKDVDGFHPQSKFSPPIAQAVLKILEKIYTSTPVVDAQKPLGFSSWLKSKKIAVIGRGVTAGGPIIKTLKRQAKTRSDLVTNLVTITSKTENKIEILKNSDIIICAVGKANIIKKSDIERGAILIGVGMYKGEDGKFHSDYEEDDIRDTASSYTPTPGGVGPVNVAELLSNLLKASENQL